MADRPILFSAPMVRALLAGTKTQTRRLVGVPVIEQTELGAWHVHNKHGGEFVTHLWWAKQAARDYLPIQPGDRLYVREAWAPLDALTHNDPGVQAIVDRAFYRADGSTVEGEISRWRPGIHMPRCASRLTLHVTDVRVQRLQDITEADAMAEGCEAIRNSCYVFDDTAYDRIGLCHSSPITAYSILWDHINGAGSWDANPWVAAYTFTVEHANIDRARVAA